MILATRVALQKSEPLLVKRLGQLTERLQAGEEAVWGEFVGVVQALVALSDCTAPEKRGSPLKTKEMADKLGVSVKTLLRHKRDGKITPAVEQGGGPGKGGRLLRWSGQERLG